MIERMRRPYADPMSENLPEHVAENRRYWDASVDDWISSGERAWEQEASWGNWRIPNTELPLLPDERCRRRSKVGS
jgi:hypothetical protein